EAEVSERVRPHLREHLRPVPGHGSAGEETAGPRTLLIVSHGPSSSPRLLIISFHHAPSPRRRPRPDRSRNESVTLPASAVTPGRRGQRSAEGGWASGT